jgi:tetratricopeptide (TPR) repeat protein
MGKRRELLICLLLIVVVIGCATHTSWGQENDTVNLSPPSLAESEFNHEDILNHAQRSLDRSISILNTVATLMGVLVALLTLIFVIGGAFGIFEARRWIKIRELAKKSADVAKEYADETKKVAEEAKPTLDDLKKAKEEMDTLRECAKDFLAIPEPFSEDQKKILDEHRRKFEFFEAHGVPLKSEDYNSYGEYRYQQDRYELALKAIDKAIELKPDFVEAWYNRGVVFLKLDQNDEALEAIDKAIELKPDFADAWNNRGVALDKLYRYDEALKAYDKAIELKPGFAKAWNGRGVALGKLDRRDDALEAFHKATDLKPDLTEAWYNKAFTYNLKGDKEKTLKNLSKAIDLDAKYREKAKSDEDFKNLWDDEYFKRIVS